MTVAQQMFSAEVLKLRRNRGLLAFAFLLTIGIVALYFAYGAIRHGTDPSQYGPSIATGGANVSPGLGLIRASTKLPPGGRLRCTPALS